MSKFKFREIRMSKDNKARLSVINQIIEEYQEEGYVLTLRQLYYQLVSRDIIPNKSTEYAKLSKLLKEGRMSGNVDWDAIEDRLRKPSKPSAWDSPEEILDAVISQYEKPRMEGQSVYLEVWVEKDALSGVLSRVTKKYHVPILVNRGYSSVSAMYDSFHRFRNAHSDNQEIKILYLGDYDPSGIDMIRDIEERTLEFVRGYYNEAKASSFKFSIIPIALTREQIRTYNPPPNPAKMEDPRAANFVELHGKVSWEVDALRPDVLHKLLEDSILDNIDEPMYQEIVNGEDSDKNKLRSLKRFL